jgi:ABC-type transport system involved in cytochrome c biogenesis permease component
MMSGMNHGLERLRELGMSRRHPGQASWITLAALVVLFVFGLSTGSSMAGIGGILMIAGSFALLGVAGWLWGVDTRDGADWKDRRPGAIR